MTAEQFLAGLRQSGIVVEAADGRLKVSAPKGAMTDAVRDEIRSRRDELLAALQAGTDSSGLMAAPRGGDLPLSRFQRRLWIMSQLRGPEDSAYALAVVWTIAETRDPALLEAAIRDVSSRHEILRTAFPETNGEPVARVLPAESVPIRRLELEGLAPERWQSAVDARLADRLSQPFDLQRAPVFRWDIVVGPEGLGLVVSTHHIAIDHWSFTILRRELGRSIQALTRREALAPPGLQYADYAAWQAHRERDGVIRPHLEWWAARLANPPELSIVPPDRESDGRQAWRTTGFTWDETLTAGLKRLAREERATLYMVLLALCAAALRRQTGQTDLIVGSSTGTRERTELETMIGPFVNVLALRFELEDDPSFATLVQRARDAVLDGMAHADAPFEMIVERLNPARSFEHTPLFQLAVVMHNGEVAEHEADVEGGGAMYDMTWYAREQAGGLAMGLEYRSDLYSEAAVARLTGSLAALARSALEDRHRPVSRMSLAPPAEVARQIASLNPPSSPVADPPFPEAFARQAAATPDRTALRYAGQALSYRALDAMADRIARLLQARGVAHGHRVGLCLGRSPLMVAAMIGVQKLGAAYVPLDPAFPGARLAFMAEDSGLGVIVADAGQAEIAASLGCAVLVVGEDTLAGHDGGAFASQARADDAAYVIYTSGSTGRPNGVVIPHGALSNFLAAVRAEPGLSADDVVAAITTMSFDIAVLELLAPLLVGACIELVDRELASDGAALATLLDRSGATLLQATPATWRLLLDAGWAGKPGLRALCGGEPLPRDLADALLDRLPELWNLYGPTEATVWATAGRVAKDRPIDIGRPLANTRIYVVDENGALVPPGIAGELLIGGQGLAVGYHARPELNAARFAEDPFVAEPGARIYRTGDLGLWSDDGVLRHLGRIDHQVKVRGFRIELGEIETALARHPAVRQAVVAQQGRGAAARLVAYVVPKPGASATTSELRHHLRALLPDYMTPSLYMTLDSVPLTPNGKVDRKALPAPGNAALVRRSDDVPCHPGLETELAEIWKEVLAVDSVSAHDNFFEVGGHSLLSLRVVRAVEQRTGLRMEPRMLFTHSLRNIAENLRKSRPSTGAMA